MIDSSQWFQALRVASGARSDYQLAKFLGITHGAVSHYSTGRRTFGPDVALKAADFINVPAQAALVASNYWKAQTDTERQVWQAIYNQIGGMQVDEIISELANHREAA